MLPLVFLCLALASALISRFLLVKAAFSMGIWWGLGVFVPFGPTLFRLNYPEEARQARMFGLATLALTFAYVIASPELLPSTHIGFVKSGGPGNTKWHFQFGSYLFGKFWKPKPTIGSNIFDPSKPKDMSAPQAPSLEERRQANARELADLRAWNERLKLKKRDLLHSDAEGNRMYAIEVDSYNAALTKATSEHAALLKPK